MLWFPAGLAGRAGEAHFLEHPFRVCDRISTSCGFRLNGNFDFYRRICITENPAKSLPNPRAVGEVETGRVGVIDWRARSQGGGDRLGRGGDYCADRANGDF
jgi:hypothetical protein